MGLHERIVEGINGHEFRRIARKHSRKGLTWRKYFNLNVLESEASIKFRALNLHRVEEKKKVFDVGCGFGMFIRACTQWGHEAFGLDGGDSSSLFTEVWECFGVSAFQHKVGPFECLPEAIVDMDLITFFGFSGLGKARGDWDAWKFLMDDCWNRLNRGGRVICIVNDGYSDLLNADRWTRLCDELGARFDCRNSNWVGLKGK